LSSEVFTKHGLNVSCCLFDEIHAQQTRDLFDVMTFGSGDARLEPLFFYITTAGDDPDRLSIGWELHNKAKDILMGNRIDNTFYAVIFGIDVENKTVWDGWGYKQYSESINWHDKKLWSIVNPSIGEIMDISVFEESYDSVIGNEVNERLFKQFRLNIWNRYRITKWIDTGVWEQCGKYINFDDLYYQECYGGLDLSSKLDITAFILVFPPNHLHDDYLVLCRFWIPENNINQVVKKDKFPYDLWVQHGYLKTTTGNKIDQNYIKKEIIELNTKYEIKSIGYDPWHGDQLAIDLENEGFEMVEVRQNYSDMSPAMAELEALLKTKSINHGNNPILNWMFGNLEVVSNENGEIRPSKKHKRRLSNSNSTPLKIDGIVALIISISVIGSYNDLEMDIHII